MANSGEDIDGNVFFRSLQTVFRSKFDEAQKRQWVICVPQSSSIRGVKITGQFVDNHILKPSPYFKSHYVTTDKNNNGTVQIDGNSIKLLSRNSGSFEGDEVKILSEELSYNQDFQPFKLYVVDHPLNSACFKKGKPEVNTINQYSTGPIKPVLTLQQCKTFFSSISSNSAVLESIDKAVFRFNKNYIVLPNYLHDAANKLKDIIDWAVNQFLELNHTQLDESEQLRKTLNQAVENYVLIQVHNKVFSVIREKYSSQDNALSRRIKELHQLGLTPDQLGVQEAFCYPPTSAVVELASLNGKMSPAEKLQCLQTTLELIPEDICNSHKDSSVPFKKLQNIPPLTSDDLIPILVTLIVQARIQNLESNLYYIQNFTWNASNQDKLSFSLVTFQAAKEFLVSHDFKHLKPSSKKIKKEISLEELMNVTAQIQRETKKKSDVNGSKNTREDDDPEPVDKHLHKVTKMIEISTRESNRNHNSELPSGTSYASYPYKPVFIPRQNSRSEELGEFLLNLQENCLGVTYGRQS